MLKHSHYIYEYANVYDSLQVQRRKKGKQPKQKMKKSAPYYYQDARQIDKNACYLGVISTENNIRFIDSLLAVWLC